MRRRVRMARAVEAGGPAGERALRQSVRYFVAFAFS